MPVMAARRQPDARNTTAQTALRDTAGEPGAWSDRFECADEIRRSDEPAAVGMAREGGAEGIDADQLQLDIRVFGAQPFECADVRQARQPTWRGFASYCGADARGRATCAGAGATGQSSAGPGGKSYIRFSVGQRPAAFRASLLLVDKLLQDIARVRPNEGTDEEAIKGSRKSRIIASAKGRGLAPGWREPASPQNLSTFGPWIVTDATSSLTTIPSGSKRMVLPALTNVANRNFCATCSPFARKSSVR